MELLDLPEEILLEILSKLDQATVHLTAAFVSKRFLQLTRSPQLLQCVEFEFRCQFLTTPMFNCFQFRNSDKFQSLLVMLRHNKHLKKIILGRGIDGMGILDILKVVAPHGSLRHLEFVMEWPVPDKHEEDWKEVFSQICAKLTSIKYRESKKHCGPMKPSYCLAPLENAKNLTWLTLENALLTSETFRQIADNYTCLQNVHFFDVDCSENSAMAYFLEKQSHTLTSLNIYTPNENPLPAIYKCQYLKKLDLFVSSNFIQPNLDSLGSLSKLKCLHLTNIDNSDLGKSIATAKFQDLTEIHFSSAYKKDGPHQD
jgi:hypothetical protein